MELSLNVGDLIRDHEFKIRIKLQRVFMLGKPSFYKLIFNLSLAMLQ